MSHNLIDKSFSRITSYYYTLLLTFAQAKKLIKWQKISVISIFTSLYYNYYYLTIYVVYWNSDAS